MKVNIFMNFLQLWANLTSQGGLGCIWPHHICSVSHCILDSSKIPTNQLHRCYSKKWCNHCEHVWESLWYEDRSEISNATLINKDNTITTKAKRDAFHSFFCRLIPQPFSSFYRTLNRTQTYPRYDLEDNFAWKEMRLKSEEWFLPPAKTMWSIMTCW